MKPLWGLYLIGRASPTFISCVPSEARVPLVYRVQRMQEPQEFWTAPNPTSRKWKFCIIQQQMSAVYSGYDEDHRRMMGNFNICQPWISSFTNQKTLPCLQGKRIGFLGDALARWLMEQNQAEDRTPETIQDLTRSEAVEKTFNTLHT